MPINVNKSFIRVIRSIFDYSSGKFDHPHIVHFHFDRQFGILDFSGPTAECKIENQIITSLKRPLHSLPFIQEMQVHMAKRFYVVDIKHQSVVGNLDRIAMKRLDVDLGSPLIAGRSRSSMMMDKVAVHGLINEIIAIQMFHNINLPHRRATPDISVFGISQMAGQAPGASRPNRAPTSIRCPGPKAIFPKLHIPPHL